MRSILAVLMTVGALAWSGGPTAAAPRNDGTAVGNTDISAQSRRVRPQIRVQRPYYYRRFHSAYPLPYDVEYPGPNAVRQCVDRYVTEFRPSGTVIVPRIRCWWVPG